MHDGLADENAVERITMEQRKPRQLQRGLFVDSMYSESFALISKMLTFFIVTYLSIYRIQSRAHGRVGAGFGTPYVGPASAGPFGDSPGRL